MKLPATRSVGRLVTFVVVVPTLIALGRLQSPPNPLWIWIAFSVTYLVLELVVRRKPGPGWIVCIAMAAALEPSGAAIGVSLTLIVATAIDAVRGSVPVGDRIIAHLPPSMIFLAVAVSADMVPWSVAVGGAVAGVAAHALARFVDRDGSHPTPHRPFREAARDYLEGGLVGVGAGLMGLAVAEVGGLAVPIALTGVLVLAAAEVARIDLHIVRAQVVRSLLTAVEAKDLYTRGHAERVARYARLVGGDLGITGARLDALETAALLHDVGKVVTPRHLLRKPGRLTPDEYCRIQHHAAVVPEVLGRLRFLEPVVPVIAEHHIHFDGAGYGQEPLPASDLSLEARILAVADSFDAITTHRPYRRALSRAYAFDELRRCAGTQFDPAVVDAFVAGLERRDIHPPAVGMDSETVARDVAEELAHV